ncbi:ubiquilin [Nematocida displodere]|uniref:Ubiquilin n=1 Tax=Nematocida displodere TaxID=1805483 RepID=A0A177ECB0_9MICR|nr:ubiquilin [Nematocida displodere]
MHRVTVKYMQESFEVEVEDSETIDDLKKKIAEKVQILPDRQRLTHKGCALSHGTKTIHEAQIQATSTIYVNKIEQQTGPKEIVGEVQPKQEVNNGLGMMKDPAMKKIFSNPDVMKGILEMFPDMKKENPEIKKLMESSQMLEEMAKIAEDPQYMNTQMKNVDIAMAKLETIPGGFNMLRSMLKTQTDPNAGLVGGADSTIFSEGGAITAETKQGPVPNPWGTYNFNPLVEYRQQVEYMTECGFTDTSANIRLLIKHQGDVDEAISEMVCAQSTSPVTDSESRS